MTTFMVGLSMAFAAYLTMERIPHKIAAAMLSVTDNRIVLLLLINVFLLFIGCLIDNIPATIILSPILLPVVTQIGMSPITFGSLDATLSASANTFSIQSVTRFTISSQ